MGGADNKAIDLFADEGRNLFIFAGRVFVGIAEQEVIAGSAGY
jgi:hypothetical protein